MHERRQLIALVLAAVLTVAGLATFKKPVAYADGTTGNPEGTTASSEGTTGSAEGSTASSEGPVLYTVTYSDGLGGSVFPDYTFTDLWYGQKTPLFPYAEVTNPGYVLYGFDPPVTDAVEVSVT